MGSLESLRQSLGNKNLDELADWKASIGSASQNDQVANAEFSRRQTLAAIEAADAAKATAKFTKQNARYMLWSVCVLALSSVATLIVAILKK